MAKDIHDTSIYTVATTNHLKQAIVALESAKKYSSYNNYYIFIIDIKDISLKLVNKFFKEKYPWIQIFSPFNLDIFYKDLILQAFNFYTALEVCCLSKFIGLKYLTNYDLNTTKFVYIDTDLFFFSDLYGCLEQIEKESFIVTPHDSMLSNPYKEREILQSGWLNAGFFIGNIKGTNFYKILDYLIERIFSLGYDAVELGLYVDQKWLNFIYQTFPKDFITIRNPGYNIAYWNIENRKISKKNNYYLVNNEKLVFFHFSGFSTNLKDRLSIHSDFYINKNQEIKEVIEIYKCQFSKVRVNIKNPSIYSLNKMSLKRRINLRIKTLGFNFLGSSYKNGLFSYLGYLIDKTLIYITKKIILFLK